MSAATKAQIIRSIAGKPEYVLLPFPVYQALRGEIESRLSRLRRKQASPDEYLPFRVENYVDNPVALARIKARVTQAELARRMGVSQAYISKIERQAKVTPRVLDKAAIALEAGNGRKTR